jgi:hypothetical protein
MRNILSNPVVGMIFVVRGFKQTIRVNGAATILHVPELCTEFAVSGRPALPVMRISFREALFHRGKP